MSHTLRSKLSAFLPMLVAPVLLLIGYLIGGRSIADTGSWSGFGYAILAFGGLFLGIFMLYTMFRADTDVPSGSRSYNISANGVAAKLILAILGSLAVLSFTQDHAMRFVCVVSALVIISPAAGMLSGWRNGTAAAMLPFAMLVFALTLWGFGVLDYIDTGLLVAGIVTSYAAAILGSMVWASKMVTPKMRDWSLQAAGFVGIMLTGMAIPAGSFDDWPGAVMLGVIVSAVHPVAARLSGEKSFAALTGHRNGVWSLLLGACFEVIIPGSALIVLIAVVTSNVLRVVLGLLRKRQLRRRAAQQRDEATEEDAPPAPAAN